jgi:hypothetical protein
MRPLPLGLLALAATLPSLDAATMARRTVQEGKSRVGASHIWRGEDTGISVDATLDLYNPVILRAYHTRIDFDLGGLEGASSGAGLGLREANATGKYSITYVWGRHDDGLVARDRDSLEIAYAYDFSPSWELEVAHIRYDNPADLGGDLNATKLTFRYNSGSAFNLDLGWSRKDTLGGTEAGGDDTWSAGISLRF